MKISFALTSILSFKYFHSENLHYDKHVLEECTKHSWRCALACKQTYLTSL